MHVNDGVGEDLVDRIVLLVVTRKKRKDKKQVLRLMQHDTC